MSVRMWLKMGLGGPRLTLSGETITTGDPSNATAAVRVDQDGNVYSVVNGVSTQIDTDTDWVRPASAAPGDYEVRMTNVTGDTPASTTAENIWHPLSSGDWQAQIARTSPGENQATFDLELRHGSSGGAIRSAEYQLNAVVI